MQQQANVRMRQKPQPRVPQHAAHRRTGRAACGDGSVASSQGWPVSPPSGSKPSKNFHVTPAVYVTAYLPRVPTDAVFTATRGENVTPPAESA